MKLLTKLITAISLSTLVCTPLFASTNITITPAPNTSVATSVATIDETTGLPILTLEESIKGALSKNNSLALNSQQHTLLQEQMNSMDDIGAYKYQQIYISYNQNVQQREFLKDKVTADITKRYNSIILIGEEIKNIEANIALKKEAIKVLEIQKKAGMAISLQIDAANLELKNLEANKLAKEETLKSEKEAFLMLTNKDLNKYALENSISFEPFRLENPKAYFQTNADKYLKYQNELAVLQSDNIFENFINPVTGSAYAPTYAEYLSAKYSASSATLNVKDSKDTLVQNLLSSYASLLNMEEQINTLESQKALIEKQLATAAVQRKVGMMTKLEYEQQAIKLDDLSFNLVSLINSYNLLVQTLQKPWS
ncbi:TolC family protein [Cellulosilyticum ruminicola]|uniref:TolC family protein n=1 Tax=Cellulosilyticum ruminicola TaxID=425254 RepID=UPI0006D1F7AC|nr:TolC family protein [Cellulosilyticum ruminicola]